MLEYQPESEIKKEKIMGYLNMNIKKCATYVEYVEYDLLDMGQQADLYTKTIMVTLK